MSEYESNDLEAENLEEEEQNDQKEELNNTSKNNINNNQNEENENDNVNEEEQENENESENNNINNNIISKQIEEDNNTSNANKSKKDNKIKNTKSQYTENSLSQNNNNNVNNTLTKKTEENNEEENPEILYEEFFNYFLPNKRNTLSIKECKNAMRCLGLVVTEREIQKFLEIKVKTGKEKINLEEFKYICNKKLNENGNNINELEAAFEIMDPEKTGIVDSKILRHQMKVFKPKITNEEIDQILSEFGEDEDGNINYREYLKNLKN